MIDEIKNKIKIALDAVEGMDGPYKLEAFKIVLEKLLNERILEKNLNHITGSSPSLPTIGIEDCLKKLATECNIMVDELKNVLDYENNKFILLKKIEEKSDSKKQVIASHCIVTAYMKGLSMEWVSASVLREVVDKNGLGDPSNLASNLAKSGIFRIKGQARGTEYSLTTEGWQAGIQTIRNMAQSQNQTVQ